MFFLLIIHCCLVNISVNYFAQPQNDKFVIVICTIPIFKTHAVLSSV